MVDSGSSPGTDVIVSIDDTKAIETGELTYALRMIGDAVLKSKNLRLNANG